MGVHGLWQLLLPISRRVSIETLSGKTIAVDASIWLTQFIKAMRDESGEMMWNAHILGSLRRILRMLFHGIRPVFVFDGATPEIKMREVKERRERRERGNASVKRTAKRLLVEALKAGDGNLLGSKAGSKDGDGNKGKVDEGRAFAAGFVDGTAYGDEEKAEGGGAAVTTTKAARKEDEERLASEMGQNQNVDSNMEGVFDADDDSEDETNWEDGNAQADPNEAWETRLPENGDLDMEVVKNLPKDMRKDVVEKAKSRHRINTRKQYMPVAADPMAFSNIQLVNFLKASKMNKSIEKMAKDEVGNTEEGFVMASDRSKVIVMKDKVEDDIDFSYMQRGDSSGSSSDDDDDDGEEEEEVVEVEVEVEGRGAKSRGLTKIGPKGGNNDSSGSSSEEEEERGQEKAKELDQMGAKAKSTKAVTFDSSGSSSEEEDEVVEEIKVLKNRKPTKKVTARETATVEKKLRKRYEDDESSDEEVDLAQNKEWAEEQMRRDEQIALEFQREEEESAARARKEVSINEQIALGIQRGEEEDAALVRMTYETGAGASDKNTTITLDFSAPRPAYNMFDDPSPKPQEDIENSSGDEITAAQAAAFSEAAADAKKLTSWAGRAVARAIKQHVGHAPKANSDDREEEDGPTDGNSVKTGATDVDVGVDEAGDDDMSDGTEDNSQEQLLKPESNSVALPPPLDLPPVPKKRSELVNNRPVERTNEELDESNRMIELARETQQMQKDMKRGDRDDDGITEDMKEDVIKLLQAFGMPYIIAPAEAEAQCCKLEELGLVDGIITQDSDAFVFGGQTVYRNIFDERKFVEVYLASDADKEMGLKRQHFIALAMLLGGDYTPGVSGVGIVNGVEILSAFPVGEDPTKALNDFKEWMNGFDPLDLVKGNTKITDDMTERQIFHQKHKKMRNSGRFSRTIHVGIPRHC
ncbi:hypothetical protein TrRE_jg7353 [Triparma retinervis]|uniref:Uncharacterized protein n=1 Tax=Triparma retinervis TaxID=2557542 RepID=A0A9W7CHJ7_9STRA|nr:hypothetical protein TrRE_jg7353 [Triparma retinervis]